MRTFIITFAKTGGSLAIRPADFTITDEEGRRHHPRVTALSGAPPPRRLAPGRPVSLEVYDVLPTGSGSLAWAPGLTRPLVSCDFDVEID